MKIKDENMTSDGSSADRTEKRRRGTTHTAISSMTLPEMEKIIDQLEERREELENEIGELRRSQEAAESALRRLNMFYQNAAVGCFTVNPDSVILELNYRAAELLGRERKDLLESRLKNYLSHDTQRVFNDFLLGTFQSDSIQSCQVKVKIENDITSYIRLEGVALIKERKCYITASDITDNILAEKTVYDLLNEKEVLLREVHHRVKNNMYNIGLLLNLQANRNESEAAKNVLYDAAGRVQSMSVLYDKLYRSEHIGAVSLKEYLADLIYEIVEIFPQKKSVKIRTEIDDVVLSAKTLSILGILVNELVSNAMKYAFTGRNDGLLSVTSTNNDNRITITIADNGTGMPESVTFNNSTGFGMQLVGMLTEQLGGSIRIERGEGTRFVLEFEV